MIMTTNNQKIGHSVTSWHSSFAIGIFTLFAGITLFSDALAAQSFSSSVFTQAVFYEVIDEETCVFSTPEVAYPYVQLHANIVKLNETTSLSPVTQVLMINCSRPVGGMRLFVSGDAAASSVTDGDPTHFGLGHVNGQGSLGIYTVMLSGAQVEGQAVQLSQSAEKTAGGQHQSSVMLQSGQFQHWVASDGSPASGHQFSVNMTVSPILNSQQGTHGPLVDGAELNGDLALTFSFGI